MFSLITGRHIGGQLCKVAWNASTNNSETMYRTDLRIGEVVKRFVSLHYNFLTFLMEQFRIYVLLRDSVNYL